MLDICISIELVVTPHFYQIILIFFQGCRDSCG